MLKGSLTIDGVNNGRFGARGPGTCQKLQSISWLAFRRECLARPNTTLVQEWLGLAGNLPLAYVSPRRSDDPAFFGRVVIATGPDTKPSHTIHTPSGLDQSNEVQQFDTLREALNSVRPVLP